MKTIGRMILLFSSALFAESQSNASVMYSTMAESEMFIGADDVELGLPFDGSFFEVGNGVAGFSGSATPDGEFPVHLLVEVFGSAFAPPFSYATSTFMSGHIITIDNLGGPGDDTSEISVPFVFSYSWKIDLARDFPDFEFASAGAFFDISGIDNEALFIDGVGFVPRYLHHIMETTEFGGTGSSGLIEITGKIVVPAETLSKFSVITDTTGFAVATVPEPSTLALFATGVMGLLIMRRGSRR